MVLNLKHINIVALLSISYLLLAQDITEQDTLQSSTTDTTSLYAQDTTHSIEQVFNNKLIIPSYEELLDVYYHAVVKVDKTLNFNIYRITPTPAESIINPYVYAQVIYQESPFDIYQNNSASYPNPSYQIYNEIVKQVSADNPQMMTATSDMIPDPPKTEKRSIIYSINVDLSHIDTSRQSIRKPDKIERLRFRYQPWHVKAMSMLNANQTAFSNWAKGGENSFTLSGSITVDADYESMDKKTKWDNDMQFRLGYIQQENAPFVKNLDYFMCNTRYARNAVNNWFYALNAQLTTQFFEGYDIKSNNFDDPTSNFFTPAYLKIALGLDYKYGTDKQKKLFSMQASPLSYKLTYVRDTGIVKASNFGIDDGKKGRQEIGGSVEFVSKYDIKDKFSGRSRLLFFSNYIDNPQNVDLNWNTSLTYHFSRIFSVSFSLDMAYDDDVDIKIKELDDGTNVYSKRLQIKEFLGFGLTYRLM